MSGSAPWTTGGEHTRVKSHLLCGHMESWEKRKQPTCVSRSTCGCVMTCAVCRDCGACRGRVSRVACARSHPKHYSCVLCAVFCVLCAPFPTHVASCVHANRASCVHGEWQAAYMRNVKLHTCGIASCVHVECTHVECQAVCTWNVHVECQAVCMWNGKLCACDMAAQGAHSEAQQAVQSGTCARAARSAAMTTVLRVERRRVESWCGALGREREVANLQLYPPGIPSRCTLLGRSLQSAPVYLLLPTCCFRHPTSYSYLPGRSLQSAPIAVGAIHLGLLRRDHILSRAPRLACEAVERQHIPEVHLPVPCTIPEIPL